jgi:hypothetical protein
MFVAAAWLVVDRGGLLAWIGTVLATLLLLKVLRWPSPRDPVLAVATLTVWALAWVVTWQYVVSTWEPGEVVVVEIGDGGPTVRVWVLDVSDGPIMYYDAPPDVASSLLAGVPLSVTRNGQVRHGCATAIRVDEVPEEQLQDAIGEMDDKYQHRNQATGVFYSILGARRDRVDVLVQLTPCE